MSLCIKCKKPAKYVCQRCLNSYCSNDCQTNDWNEHKKICFKKYDLTVEKNPENVTRPHLANNDEKITNLSVNINNKNSANASNVIQDIKEEENLETDYNISSETFKVTLIKYFKDIDYALLKALRSENQVHVTGFMHSKNILLDLIDIPKKGCLVAVRNLYTWNRAMILGSWENNTQFLVYLIDEAMYKICNEIKQLPEEILNGPVNVIAINSLSTHKFFTEEVLKTTKDMSLTILSSFKSSHIKQSLLNINTEIPINTYSQKCTNPFKNINLKFWIEDIPLNSVVYITKIISYTEVVISLCHENDYSEIFSNIATTSESYSTDDKLLKGDIVLAFSTKLNSYFRGEIIMYEPANTTFQVYDIDTGILYNLKRENIRKAEDFVRYFPVYIKTVQLTLLKDFKEIATTRVVLEYLDKCCLNKTKFYVKYARDCNIVNLFYCSDRKKSLNASILPMLFEWPQENDEYMKEELSSAINTPLPPPPIEFYERDTNLLIANLNKQLKNLSLSNFESISPEDTVNFTIADLKIIPLTIKNNRQLLILDRSNIAKGYVTAIDYDIKENLSEVNRNHEIIRKHCEQIVNENGYYPKLNELCLAKFHDDENWYRATCLNQLDDDTVTVLFIDFGNSEKLSKNDILPIQKEFMFPIYANTCFIQNVLTEDELLNLKHYIDEENIIDCNVLEEVDKGYNITINKWE